MSIAVRKSLISIFVLSAFTLSACGDKESKPTATQTAAKVGSEEISVHQINQVLSRTNTSGSTPEAAKAMGRDVLEKLIDQQLAVGKAIELKLDRTPETVAAIEAARKEILSRAYLQKVTSALAKPSPEEAQKYFAEHPQLFSQRRIFNIQEIVAQNAPGLPEQLRSMAAAGKPMDEVAAFLKSKDVKFNGGSATRPAEQIPLELLDKVHALKDGQNLVLESAQSVTFLRLASSQSSPIPQAAAMPRIEQFLTNKRATETITADIKQLRSATTITYMGEFATAKSPDSPAAAPVATTPATDKPEEKSAQAQQNAAQSAIEKGVAGLK